MLADFHVLDMVSDPTCPLLIGRGFLATASAKIDCKESKIAVGEGNTWSVYNVKKQSYDTSEEATPDWLETIRKSSRYGPWIERDSIGPQCSFYIEKYFVNRTHMMEQLLDRDTELDPFEDPLVFRKMTDFLGVLPINLAMNKWTCEDKDHKWKWDKPPKDGDGSWHIRMTLYDPDGEKFENIYRTKQTNRKLQSKLSPKDVLEDDLTYVG